MNLVKVLITVLMCLFNSQLALAQNDVPAEFPGGNTGYHSYMQSHLKFPKLALEAEADRTIKVIVRIDSVGRPSVQEFVYASSGLGFEEEVISFIQSMPMWKPALYNGVPSASQVILTFDFKFDHPGGYDNETGDPLEIEDFNLEVHETSDIPPFFEFGLDSLKRRVRDILNRELEQEVGNSSCKLLFIVDTSGRLLNVSLLESVGSIEDKHWIYAFQISGAWQPGLIQGRKVNVQTTVSFSFSSQ